MNTRKISFTKMVASGNDFVVVDGKFTVKFPSMARLLCDRKLGIGADGLLVLNSSKKADIRMRIFNADGSEAKMCGNGARCIALYMGKRTVSIETAAGIIESKVSGNNVKIKLTRPEGIKLDMPIKLNRRPLRVNFVDTGVPHVVVFVAGIDKIDVVNLGRLIRNHKAFSPDGANVNFVEVIDDSNIKVRTYERGVEDETLACGTGSVASAIVTRRMLQTTGQQNKINVKTQGGEVLKVYFDNDNGRISNVWLEGKVKTVYKGEWNV